MTKDEFLKKLFEETQEYEPEKREFSSPDSFSNWKNRNNLDNLFTDKDSSNQITLEEALLALYSLAKSYGDAPTLPILMEEISDLNESPFLSEQAFSWAQFKSVLKNVENLEPSRQLSDNEALDMIERYKVTSKSFHNLGLPNINNARDMGGYATRDGMRLKRGKLLRCAHLGNIDSNDVESLINLSLKDIVDFRTESEASAIPDPIIEGVDYNHIDIMKGTTIEESAIIKEPVRFKDPIDALIFYIESGLISKDMYVDFEKNSGFKKGYRKFFDILLNQDEESSVLFHCSAGKDRTGIAAILLMLLFGVEDELIKQEYLLTNDYSQEELLKVGKILEAKGTDKDIIRDVQYNIVGTDWELVERLFNAIQEDYGGMDEFLTSEKGLNLTPEEIQKLRDLYLEPV